MIGLGIGDPKDITLKGIEAIKSAEHVFLEYYTSIIATSVEEMEKFYGKKITVADRTLVENNAEIILEPALRTNVAFLVIGDVFGATTHSDLFLRAKMKGVDVKIINNASIMNVIGNTGLELYKFGKTTSIVFDDDGWLPETPYDVIKDNKKRGLHTLCLLDIKVAEPSKENLRRGINKPEPARFMTVNKALEILKKIEDKRKENIISEDTLVVGMARLGSEHELMKAGKLKDIVKMDFGAPLHSLIIPGELHEMEEEMIKLLAI